MNELTALQAFLSRALTNRKERYLSFVAKPKTHAKFLNTLYHDLEEDLHSNLVVDVLPDRILDSPGFLFEASGSFGNQIGSLREISDSHIDACLAISTTGDAGIYCPETFIDSRLYLLVGKAHSK